ncbi:Guanylyl cyclase [Zychaea mexicana]|uniref:Guanylyl cyclase n=1 Tax=Zychaea mexicana TaxID=64656 RepID=UPI0022FE403F|nr:Guanylyl cyclase [Zychaea mexicana]KAI9498854.1 Guanylyl cyclase [Zychaea mexicana]
MSSTHEIINYNNFENHKIPHIMQHSDWDCGLACIAMTLKGLGIESSVEQLTEEIKLTSIWTIDLAFLLRKYEPDFTFYTSVFGTRKEYKGVKFYEATFDQDEKRVNKLFASAKSCSVHIVRMKLPIEDYKRFLFNRQFAVIALVNARLLHCQRCEARKGCMASVCGQFFYKMSNDDYIGHYIVLIGYDPTEDLFVYRDPANMDDYCTIAADDFDQARQAEGTDHDCIIVKL